MGRIFRRLNMNKIVPQEEFIFSKLIGKDLIVLQTNKFYMTVFIHESRTHQKSFLCYEDRCGAGDESYFAKSNSSPGGYGGGISNTTPRKRYNTSD